MIIPSQNTVEELLYKDKSEVLGGEVREALQAAAGPYKELITYYNELVAVHRHVVNNSGAASGSAGRFKAIAAWASTTRMSRYIAIGRWHFVLHRRWNAIAA
jgi:hypothetical protein